MTQLKTDHITKAFVINKQKQIVVDKFTHTFSSGNLYVMKGSSGCGKSTLLSMISLLQDCDEGCIYINDERADNLSEQEKQRMRLLKLGIVFQDSNLLNGLNVFDNIVLAAHCEKTDTKENISRRAEELLELLHIHNRKTSYPLQLSGGERQRAGIARAIFNNPDILICDEPISSLDEENADTIIQFLSEYCHKENKLVIVSCHSSQFDASADEIIKMGVN